MNKKIRKLLLLGAGVLAMTAVSGCSQKRDPSSLKIGLILLHPAASSTYDKNFREAFEAAQAKLGFQAIVQENIPEGEACQVTAEEMAEQGCDIVFADSFGHEDYMIEAAKNYPGTMFCHATGVKAASAGVKNFYNAFATI